MSRTLPFRRSWLASLVALACLAGCAQGLPTANAVATEGLDAQAKKGGRNLDAWRDDIIYFVLTDRFHNGDRSNDHGVKKSDPHAYHGGDLEGVIKKLDYIKDLGATAIWITPVNENKPDALVDKYWGFHGYWIHNFDAVDRRLGDEATFKRLSAEAHKRGMKVMLDIVANHAGYDAPLTKDASKRDWFHHNGNIRNWESQHELEYNDIHGLPDFNTENPEVVKFMSDTWSRWIKKADLDGFRVDTVKHVPIPFWSQFNANVKAKAPRDFMILGEVLHGDPNYMAPYTKAGKFDSLFDFPMYYTLTDVFAKGASMRQLGSRLAQDGVYADASLLSPFLDNHDVPRFMSQAGGDEKKLRLALSFLMTMRGVPTIYYGTEIGMKGAGEPENREDMAFGANASLTAHVRKLAHLRQGLAPLRRGKMLEMWQDDQVYGFSRHVGRDEVIVLLNNDTKPQTREIPLRAESALSDGVTLADQLGGASVVIADRKLRVTIGPKQAQILVPTNRARRATTRE